MRCRRTARSAPRARLEDSIVPPSSSPRRHRVNGRREYKGRGRRRGISAQLSAPPFRRPNGYKRLLRCRCGPPGWQAGPCQERKYSSGRASDRHAGGRGLGGRSLRPAQLPVGQCPTPQSPRRRPQGGAAWMPSAEAEHRAPVCRSPVRRSSMRPTSHSPRDPRTDLAGTMATYGKYFVVAAPVFQLATALRFASCRTIGRVAAWSGVRRMSARV